MKRFNNILCAVAPGAGCKPALERAVTLAENNQASLTVIDVAERVRAGIGVLEGLPVSADLQAAVVSVREQELCSLIEPYRQRINVQTKVLVGTPFLEIIQEVVRSGGDLLIKTAETRDWQNRLFGSDDMHLLRKCPCPVWIMLPEEKPSYSRIMAAVDFDPWLEVAEENELNRLILELASSMALSEFAELHVIHAWESMTEDMIRVFSSDLSEEQIVANVNRERRDHQTQFEWLTGRLRGWIGAEAYDYLSPRLYLRQGNARKEIPALARRIDADLVVMGTVARTGLSGFIMGNTAETILNQIDCSVLAIKPPGFITPVTLQDGTQMQTLFLALALFLLLNLGAGMWRVLRGPTAVDRMLAAQLFGTTAVAMLLLLAQAYGNAALRDVALVFALLAAVTAVAFVRRAWSDQESGHDAG